MFACINICAPHECLLPAEPRNGVSSPGTRVTDGSEPQSRCWELNPGSLKEYLMVLTTEPSLQPPHLQFSDRLCLPRLGIKALGSSLADEEREEHRALAD